MFRSFFQYHFCRTEIRSQFELSLSRFTSQPIRRTTVLDSGLQAARCTMQHRSNREERSNDPKLGRRTTEAAGQAVTHVWSNERRDPIFMYSSVVAGLASGTVSSVVCAPLDLVRTRLQVWNDVVGKAQSDSPSSRWFVFRMFRDIIKNEGVGGCFRGLTATLLTVPAFWGVYCEFYFFAWKDC